MLGIRGARVLDPVSGRDEELNLLIEDGKIVSVDTVLDERDGIEILDAAGLVLAPGLVDIHVHFRDPGFTYKEDIESGARAAARGGFSTVVCMANTKPPVDNPETLRQVLEKGAGTGIHVKTCACVTKGMQGKELTDMEELRSLGAAGFTDDGIPIMDGELLRQAMERAAKLHVPVSLHEEDPAFIENSGINQGAAAKKLGIGGASAQAEVCLVERDCLLAE